MLAPIIGIAAVLVGSKSPASWIFPLINGVASGVAFSTIWLSTYCLLDASVPAVGRSASVTLVPVGILSAPVIVSPAFRTYRASVAAWFAVTSSQTEPVEINVLPLLAGVGSALTT